MRDAKILKRKGTRVGWVLAIAITGILVLAWIDGGEEPLRPITQDIPVPGDGL